ncbi:prolyl-tRNA synthetase [Neoconidiobolus thromboides FSU 785]|nr:prolyl-tRNA synthetase [Neoconidiobolus thromboides FSU 785]
MIMLSKLCKNKPNLNLNLIKPFSTNRIALTTSFQPKKASDLLLPTLKKVNEKYTKSHELMLRAGLIRQTSSGLYSLLPMAMKSIRKLKQIVINELEDGGCQPVDLPILSSANLWKKTGRWEEMDKELFRLKDRKDNDLCLSPTFEEEMANLIDQLVQSYRQLPVKVYQIGKKYRDEMRPRSGLLRSREFIMKDLYTFDIDSEHSLITYHQVNQIYKNIFNKINVPYRCVEADTGKIGGYLSHEYHILSEAGEDTVLMCSNCGYAANQELAKSSLDATTLKVESITINDRTNKKEIELLETVIQNNNNNGSTVTITEELYQNLNIQLYKGKEDNSVLTIIPKDSDINIIKLDLAGESEFSLVSKEININLNNNSLKNTQLIIDESLRSHPFVTYLTESTIHYALRDIRNASFNEPCSNCSHPLDSSKAIEVAHTFHLEDWFSKPLEATYQPRSSTQQIPFSMGCFGIGISRLLAAIIEAKSDNNGIQWPISIAPYKIIVMPLFKGKEEVEVEKLRDVYLELEKVMQNSNKLNKEDIILEDRKQVSNGFKLKDWELIGVPIQLRLREDFITHEIIEVYNRQDLSCIKVNLNELKYTLLNLFNKLQ